MGKGEIARYEQFLLFQQCFLKARSPGASKGVIVWKWVKVKNKCLIGWKTLRKKEKLLVTSNFSFSHNVFHSYVSFVLQNVALCGKGLRLGYTLYLILIQIYL